MNSIRDMHPYEEAKLKSLVNLVEEIMPLHKWGFDLSNTFIARLRPNMILPAGDGRYPTIIYDSEYCRVMFSLGKSIKGDEFIVAYGRSHAPDDDQLMQWNGEDCYCWHWNVYDLICKFLDGLSSQEAALSSGKPPKGLEGFSTLGLENTLNDVEFPLRYHSVIWEYYGKGLFELFDLRHLELWEKYTRFVKEYYDINRRSRNLVPSLDRIC